MPSHYGFHLYQTYNREQVAAVLQPEYAFQASRGTWGIHGIVQFGVGPNYALFVTFGQRQGDHWFDESVDTHGRMKWQSQPRHNFQSAVIHNLISHDESQHDLLLFLRTRKSDPYTYLGRLQYLAHDAERIEPVHFWWQILEFAPTPSVLASIHLKLVPADDDPAVTEPPEALFTAAKLHAVDPPQVKSGGGGVPLPTRGFKGTSIDYATKDQANRKLGRRGEELVVLYEQERLTALGRADLAARVEHVALTRGDGAGYDVRSFVGDGEDELHIEVKSTSGPATTPFFLSGAERIYAATSQATYRVYRLYDCVPHASVVSFYQISASELEGMFEFTPVSYRVRLRTN